MDGQELAPFLLSHNDVRNTTHSYGTIPLECFALLTQLVALKYYFSFKLSGYVGKEKIEAQSSSENTSLSINCIRKARTKEKELLDRRNNNSASDTDVSMYNAGYVSQLPHRNAI